MRTPLRLPLPRKPQRSLRKPPLPSITDPNLGRLTSAACTFRYSSPVRSPKTCRVKTEVSTMTVCAPQSRVRAEEEYANGVCLSRVKLAFFSSGGRCPPYVAPNEGSTCICGNLRPICIRHTDPADRKNSRGDLTLRSGYDIRPIIDLFACRGEKIPDRASWRLNQTRCLP